MAYVTYDYYSNVFFGESVAETDFPALSARASEIVEELCMYRIRWMHTMRTHKNVSKKQYARRLSIWMQTAAAISTRATICKV